MNSYNIVRRMWTFSAIAKNSRNVPSIAAVPACVALLLGALSFPALGQVSLGLVDGITSESSNGKPIAEAQIVASTRELQALTRLLIKSLGGIHQ